MYGWVCKEGVCEEIRIYKKKGIERRPQTNERTVEELER
jgi:hypothetical protein